MNKAIKSLGAGFKGRTKDILILAIIGLFLLIAVWKVFEPTETETSVGMLTMDSKEEQLSYLLSQIDGVGKTEVAIFETNEGTKNVVVVCEGANNFQVVINVREAVATALGTEARNVKIYLKK